MLLPFPAARHPGPHKQQVTACSFALLLFTQQAAEIGTQLHPTRLNQGRMHFDVKYPHDVRAKCGMGFANARFMVA